MPAPERSLRVDERAVGGVFARLIVRQQCDVARSAALIAAERVEVAALFDQVMREHAHAAAHAEEVMHALGEELILAVSLRSKRGAGRLQ